LDVTLTHCSLNNNKLLKLKGGMFVEVIFIINDEVIDFDFLDNFMISEDMVMQQLTRVELINNNEVNVIRFTLDEDVRNSLIEETERNCRSDHSFNEDIPIFPTLSLII
jgi:hypothetical protein